MSLLSFMGDEHQCISEQKLSEVENPCPEVPEGKSTFLFFLPQPVLGKLLRCPGREPWAPAFLAEQ